MCSWSIISNLRKVTWWVCRTWFALFPQICHPKHAHCNHLTKSKLFINQYMQHNKLVNQIAKLLHIPSRYIMLADHASDVTGLVSMDTIVMMYHLQDSKRVNIKKGNHFNTKQHITRVTVVLCWYKANWHFFLFRQCANK